MRCMWRGSQNTASTVEKTDSGKSSIRYTLGLEDTAYDNRRQLRTALDIERTVEEQNVGESETAEEAEEQSELDKAV